MEISTHGNKHMEINNRPENEHPALSVPIMSVEEQADQWFVRMSSNLDDVDKNAEFVDWLSADPIHLVAYQAVEDLWSLAGDFGHRSEVLIARQKIRGQVRKKAYEKAASTPVCVSGRSIRQRLWQPAAMAASMMLVLFSSVLFTSDLQVLWDQVLWDDGVYMTDIGEQKSITLEDGSTIVLDTQTKVVTAYSDTMRYIVLEKGQARFDVAKNPDRPFVVEAGNGTITAIGTAFVVSKRGNSEVLVTLIEGKVAVEQGLHEPQRLPATVSPGLHPDQGELDQSQLYQSSQDHPQVAEISHPPDSSAYRPDYQTDYQRKLNLVAGQQVAYSTAGISPTAKVNVERETAWQAGRLIFEDHSLAEVLESLNTYSHKKILLGDAKLNGIKITGVFKTGDNERVVQTLKSYFSFRMSSDEQGNMVLLPNKISYAEFAD